MRLNCNESIELLLKSKHFSYIHSVVSRMFDGKSRGNKFESQLGHITFMDMYQEIISVFFSPHPLIQEGQFSV